MRLLIVHGGAVWATHDVYTGLLAGLKAGGHDVHEYALGARLDASDEWLKLLWRKQRKRGGPLADVRPTAADTQHHAGEGVLIHALRYEVDWVLVVCGAYLHPDIAVLARRAGLRLAVVLTESPYDDAQQAKVAPLYDVVFTNERVSAPLLRAYNPNTHYLPLGYDPEVHGRTREGEPMPSWGDGSQTHPPGCAATLANGGTPAHDVVFVGTAFPEREALLAGVDWTGVDLGLYGFWGHLPAGHPLRPFVHDGVLENAQAGALYRKARLGLNLYRSGAAADSLNPRAYELAADGVFTLSQPRAEVFEKFGPNVPTFTTATELQALVRHFLRFDQTREEQAGQLPAVVTEDTYHHRAAELVSRLAS